MVVTCSLFCAVQTIVIPILRLFDRIYGKACPRAGRLVDWLTSWLPGRAPGSSILADVLDLAYV